MSVKVERQQVAEELQRLNSWKLQGNQIERLFTFETFVDSMIFVNRVAEIAEEEEHHPDIQITYNKVNLTLTTHDAGGLTLKDFKIAHRIDSLLLP